MWRKHGPSWQVQGGPESEVEDEGHALVKTILEDAMTCMFPIPGMGIRLSVWKSMENGTLYEQGF